VLAGLGVLVLPTTAEALAITVPSSVSLGTVASGTTSRFAQMGTITASDSGLIAPSFTVQVSSTSFTTGAGTAALTIPKASISYWSGPLTDFVGLQTAVPGQLMANLAQPLSGTVVAFRSTGIALSISSSWNPTIIINIPPAAVAGTYTGTITHSVA
jgi:hypothetical protein